MRVFFFILISFWSTCLLGQVLPNQFPEKVNPGGDDEIYSQTDGVSVRIPFVYAKAYFSPQIRLVPISYTPSTTGNSLNRTEFVIDLNNAVWYIDGNGNAVEFAGSGSVGVNCEEEVFANLTSGNTVVATGVLPMNTGNIWVTRGGLSQRFGNDVTKSGNTFTFPLRGFEDGETVIIKYIQQ